MPNFQEACNCKSDFAQEMTGQSTHTNILMLKKETHTRKEFELHSSKSIVFLLVKKQKYSYQTNYLKIWARTNISTVLRPNSVRRLSSRSMESLLKSSPEFPSYKNEGKGLLSHPKIISATGFLLWAVLLPFWNFRIL